MYYSESEIRNDWNLGDKATEFIENLDSISAAHEDKIEFIEGEGNPSFFKGFDGFDFSDISVSAIEAYIDETYDYEKKASEDFLDDLPDPEPSEFDKMIEEEAERKGS